MIYTYKTNGTCSSGVNIDVDDDGKIKSVEFIGGCQGNLKGISSLAKGESIDKIIEKLKGIRCGSKETSCPDQLSRALELIMREKKS